MAGYSGTPLVQKLGIKPRARVGFRHAPSGFRDLVQPWPAGARVTTPRDGPLDVIVLFADTASELEREFGAAAESITPSGMGLAAGLVDVKVCAVTDVWSGLKFVRRLADRHRLR